MEEDSLRREVSPHVLNTVVSFLNRLTTSANIHYEMQNVFFHFGVNRLKNLEDEAEVPFFRWDNLERRESFRSIFVSYCCS